MHWWCSWNVTISFSYYVPLIVFLINRAFEPEHPNRHQCRNNVCIILCEKPIQATTPFQRPNPSHRSLSSFSFLFILLEKNSHRLIEDFFLFPHNANCTSNDFFPLIFCVIFPYPMCSMAFSPINRFKPPTQKDTDLQIQMPPRICTQRLKQTEAHSTQHTHCQWTVSWTNSHQSLTNIWQSGSDGSNSTSTSQDSIQLNYRCVQMCISQRWQSCIYYLWHRDTDSRACLTLTVCVCTRLMVRHTELHMLVGLFIYLFAAAAAALFALFCIVPVIVCLCECECVCI